MLLKNCWVEPNFNLGSFGLERYSFTRLFQPFRLNIEIRITQFPEIFDISTIPVDPIHSKCQSTRNKGENGEGDRAAENKPRKDAKRTQNHCNSNGDFGCFLKFFAVNALIQFRQITDF